MGYRSEVLLAVAFETKEQLEEVWAVYCLHPLVQEHDLAKDWTRTDTVHPTLWLSMDNVKWYQNYEDVQGFEHLVTLAQTFATERDFSYAWIKYRLGEDDTDIETVDSGNHAVLQDYLCETAYIRRELIHGF